MMRLPRQSRSTSECLGRSAVVHQLLEVPVVLARRSTRALIGFVAISLLGGAGAAAQGDPLYDVVLRGGRVIDPESGLDGVRRIGISNGRIAAVTTRNIRGRDSVDVTGLVVAPGFIELHAHAPDSTNYRYFAHDGVTTVLDLEGGVFPIAAWYAARTRALLNYGAAVGHRDVRITVLQGAAAVGKPSTLTDTAAAWARQTLSATQRRELVALIERGLDDGGIGVGSILQTMPGVTHEEFFRVLDATARHGATAFVHLRYQGEHGTANSLASLQEIVAGVASTGGSAHIVHLPSSGLRQTPLLLDIIERSRTRGLDISTEAYPYQAISQRLASAMFDAGWQERLGITYGDVLWPPTGERLTAESFAQYRATGGTQAAIVFAIPDSMVTLAMSSREVIVASDAGIVAGGRGHPRSAGSHARVLGEYVRERQVLSLTDAIRKMSLLPARRLERAVPQMRAKGRIKVGADADLAIFDPARVVDRATFADPARYSDGFIHVLVAGTFVVRDGRLVDGVSPGRAIRSQIRSRSR
jgi:N-acyl-D-aspartate/D-glutamate deacylase